MAGDVSKTITKNSNLKNHIQVIDVNLAISQFKQKDVNQ
jgi:hypothetical protein